MIKILIIETCSCAKDPIDAHVRNSLRIQEELIKRNYRVDILFTKVDTKKFQKKYDLILISYATPYPLINGMDKIIELNKNIPWGWITNEYNLRPNNYARKVFINHSSFVITNFDLGTIKGFIGKNKKGVFNREYSININTLLYKDFPKTKKKHNIIYYGTYRKGREKYFEKYLSYQIYLSTSSKNHKKFKHIGSRAIPIKKFSWKKPALLNFRYSLYIEDHFTHKNYNHFANRYYESLGCHCVILFEKNCEYTLKKAKLKDYKIFLINSAADYNKFNERNYEELLKIQSKWRSNIVNEQKKTLNDLEKVLKKERLISVKGTLPKRR